MPEKKLKGTNECAGAKPTSGFENKPCEVEGAIQALEQSGTDVTKNYKGDLETDKVPITTSYFEAGLCPVNVHWHLGAEHRSEGQYDENGKGPVSKEEVRQTLVPTLASQSASACGATTTTPLIPSSPPSTSGSIALACTSARLTRFIGRILRAALVALLTSTNRHSTMVCSAAMRE